MPDGRPPLTNRQAEILAFIVERRGDATLWAVADHFGMRSSTSAKDHVNALIRKGYLARIGTAGSLRVIEESVLEIPVFQTEDHVTIDRWLVGPPKGVLAIRARGDSLALAGARDGDVVFVRRRAVASEGTLVVTVRDGHTSCHRYTIDHFASLLGEVVGTFARATHG